MAPRFPLLAVALIAFSAMLPATDWFVDASVVGPGTGSKADPFRAITQALLAATANDRIFVAPGVYSTITTAEATTLNIGSNSSAGPGVNQLGLQIIATQGPATTILDGGGAASTLVRFFASAAGAKLCGFTLRNCNGSLGVIRLGSTTPGFEASNAEICHCVIENNLQGIATFGPSNLIKIHDNVIVNNTDNGIWASSSTPGSLGGGEIYHNTVVANVAMGIRLQGGTWAVYNNIIYNNPSAGIADFGVAAPAVANYTMNYNCVFANGTNYQGVAPGANDINQDPLLLNPALGNYHLVNGSPCQNAGSAALPAYVRSDFDGDSRTFALLGQPFLPDIGADEITDCSLVQLGPASLSGGVAAFATNGPTSDFEFKAFALAEGNVLLPGAGHLLIDFATLTLLDLVPNSLAPTGQSLLGVPIGGLPPAFIGASVYLQAAVTGATTGTRLTNALTVTFCP